MTAARPLLLGLDVGTTRLKGVFVELDGTEHLAGEQPTPWQRNGAHAEVDPTLLASIAQTVIAEMVSTARDKLGPISVVGVGVTGMAESGVLLDARGSPVAPIIAWHDPRGAVGEILDAFPDFTTRTGMLATPVASIMKMPLLLAMAHGTARTWLNVPEWIAVSLGGHPFSEISLASRTGLYDLERGCWWGDAFDFLGVTTDLMPGPPVVGTNGAGTATFPPIAGATIVVGGHDHQVAAYAEQAIGSNSLFDSLGTAEAIVRTVTVQPEPEHVALLTAEGTSVGATVVDRHWALLAGFRTGQILERISRLLGLDREGRRAVSSEALTLTHHQTLAVEQDAASLRILGITDDVSPAHLWRAAVDASDRAVGRSMEQFDALFGTVNDVAIGGGWLNDAAIQQVKAARFPNYRRARYREPGAVGAALMSGVASQHIESPITNAVREPATESAQ